MLDFEVSGYLCEPDYNVSGHLREHEFKVSGYHSVSPIIN